MPIKFYKTNGVPAKTFPNSEEVHFSNSGYIYVADQNGEQQVMYRTAIDELTQEGVKGLSYKNIAGDRGTIQFDFYSTTESNNLFISQLDPRIGEYKIYHEGYPPPGMMTELEKRKLLGIDPGAQVNQNAFSIIEMDSIPLNANKEKDKIIINPGSNINFSIDQTQKVVTINAVMSSALVGPMNNIEDVEVTNLENGDVMMYDANTQTWKNSSVVLDEMFLKSPDGEVWALRIQNDGQIYIENATIK